MELAFVSPPLFNDGRPVMTVVETARHFLDDFSGACSSKYRFFLGDKEVTEEVARASGLSVLAGEGVVQAPYHDDLVMAYAKQVLNDECGFDMALAAPVGRKDTVQFTHSVMQ